MNFPHWGRDWNTHLRIDLTRGGEGSRVKIESRPRERERERTRAKDFRCARIDSRAAGTKEWRRRNGSKAVLEDNFSGNYPDPIGSWIDENDLRRRKRDDTAAGWKTRTSPPSPPAELEKVSPTNQIPYCSRKISEFRASFPSSPLQYPGKKRVTPSNWISLVSFVIRHVNTLHLPSFFFFAPLYLSLSPHLSNAERD